MKTFLSHVSTEAELTKYLSDKLISHYQNKPKVHHTTMIANHSVSDIVSMPEMAAGQHNLEEGDQLVLLNAFDVTDKNPQSILDVFSVDTDVFVLLLGHFPLLPKSTTLLRKKETEYPVTEYLVMHHTTMIANHSVSDIVSMPEMAAGQHNLEEGDQLVLLNA